MKTSRAVVPVLMVAALAGCGSDPKPLTPTAIATKIGCWADTGGKPGFFVADEVTCGNPCTRHFADISTFASTKNRDRWLETVDVGGVTVVGDRWTVVVTDVGMAEMVQGKLGGEIRHAERSGPAQIPGCQ